ncbi:MAG: cytochrome c [Sphingobacteriales bacterium]|nr:cytochrome c [Sphingobacteriales bacterium]
MIKFPPILKGSVMIFCWSLLWISCSETPPHTSDKHPSTPAATDSSSTATTDLQQVLAQGKKIYNKRCAICHLENGNGIEGTFPPLVQSDFLAKNLEKAIHGTANGMHETIVVNGVSYQQAMPPPVPDLSNEELSAVITYILNEFDNGGGTVSVEQAARARQNPAD